MKKITRIPHLVLACLVGPLSLPAQFEVPGGSTGADGPLNVTTDTVLQLTEDGVFNYTTINVASGVTLSFERNANNTPVYLLATGDVTIGGSINVSGAAGTNLQGGKGGPGGYDGGNPGPVGLSGGAGHGPGGAGPGTPGEAAGAAGTAAYLHHPGNGQANHGQIYGGPLLVPMIGGSGAGGIGNGAGTGGGGGGGGILICSDTRIVLDGDIVAVGGNGMDQAVNIGSGGSVRLVSPMFQGTGTVNAYSGGSRIGGSGRGGSAGRIRVDTHDRTQFQGTLYGGVSHGSFVVARLADEPALHVVNVAGQAIDVGSGPVEILLPTDTPLTQSIQVQAMNFGTLVELEVVLKPVNGEVLDPVPLTIDNASVNPANGSVNVDVPGNTLVRVEVFKR